jgi:hypothetical protein
MATLRNIAEMGNLARIITILRPSLDTSSCQA